MTSTGSLSSGILPAQWPAIFGHANPGNQITFTEVIPNSGDPSRTCPGVPAEDVFTTESQEGLRCTFQDYMVNVFGKDDDDKAHRPISNVGVQYALSGLLAGLTAPTDPTRPPLTPSQFVALNAGVGGFDIDYDPTEERTQADPIAQERVYRSGAVNTGAHLDEVAIIDLGGPEPGAFHDIYRKYSMRDRLIREHGTADNQVFWEGQTPLLGDVTFVDASISAMDEWLAAVDADDRDIDLAQKILDARVAAGSEQRCVAVGGQDIPLGQHQQSPRYRRGTGTPRRRHGRGCNPPPRTQLNGQCRVGFRTSLSGHQQGVVAHRGQRPQHVEPAAGEALGDDGAVAVALHIEVGLGLHCQQGRLH